MSGVLLAQQQIQRAPLNPLDKSTVVSIFPIDLEETKPTLTPSNYKLPKGSFKEPSILLVESASWWKDVGEDQPLLEIPVSSIQVADSIVRDYCIGIFKCDMDGNMPGLFFIPGEHSVEQIKTKYATELYKADTKQRNWFKTLVNEADILWNRTQGNPLAIMDLMRIAAKELGIKDKPWMTNYIASVSLDNCPACGVLTNHQYPICSSCKTIINPKKFQELGLKQAQ